MKIVIVLNLWLLVHVRPNYIHSISNEIHTDGAKGLGLGLKVRPH